MKKSNKIEKIFLYSIVPKFFEIFLLEKKMEMEYTQISRKKL